MKRMLLLVCLVSLVFALSPAARAAARRPARALPEPKPLDDELPATDPQPEQKVELTAAVQGRHPRLLFTAEELPAIRRLARDQSNGFMEQLNSYLQASNPPADGSAFLTNATNAQREGLWRSPTAALHYAITGDRRSFEKALGYMKLFLELPHWELGGEQDSGMGAANVMIGAALTYDILYNDLDPQFREAYRKKLLLQARRMYYLGHLGRGGSMGYWRNDPQNNHRWHRNAGLTLCILAVAGDGPGYEWLLSKTKEELEFVTNWLPEDGTSHESPSYMIFGGTHLLLALDAADRCLGTDFLDIPFVRENVSFRMHTLTPGLEDVFCFGDCGGMGSYSNYLYLAACHNRLADGLSGLIEQASSNPGAYWLGWLSLVWFDPTAPVGDYHELPKTRMFEDLGLVFAREGWGKNDVGVMLKCGPYGGFRLNEYRHEYADGDQLQYINVAHDDPDANMFQLYADGEVLACDDGYAYNKVTSSHNTILVNGEGQIGEGHHWTQPVGDMRDMGWVTTWKQDGNVLVAEAEAGGAYEALDRYRRAVIWVGGEYVLVLDDIRAPQPVEVTWLMQASKLSAVDAAAGVYSLARNNASCEFQVVADAELAAEIGISTADRRGESMNLQQVQAKATAPALRMAAVFNPWKKGDLRVKLTPQGAGSAMVTVTGAGINDTWTWQLSPDRPTPATLKGRIEVGASDKVEKPL